MAWKQMDDSACYINSSQNQQEQTKPYPNLINGN
jgi:hypothetical protein